MIVERYITEQVVEFCSNYLSETKTIGISKSRHADRYVGRGTQGLNIKLVARDVVLEVHFYILNNLDEVQPYIDTHKKVVKTKYPQMSDKWF